MNWLPPVHYVCFRSHVSPLSPHLIAKDNEWEGLASEERPHRPIHHHFLWILFPKNSRAHLVPDLPITVGCVAKTDSQTPFPSQAPL